ncbi:MAG TPA: hypothetical protein VIQ76_05135 [Propionibacteriaceae bacterium]
MANASVEEDQVPVPELGLRDLLANAVLLSGRMRELAPAACQAFIVRPEQSQLLGPAPAYAYRSPSCF